MSLILLADAGSTKTDWSLISLKTSEIVRFRSEGINPLQISSKIIEDIISEIKAKIGHEAVTKIYFFGAGCVSEKEKSQIGGILKKIWPGAESKVESDIIAACIALFGYDEGIACIMGTGSNTCFFKNGQIINKIPSLGYILGDEGSGASLGKRLINSIYKKQLPETVVNLFQSAYSYSPEEIIQKVYKEQSSAAFLASFSPFILQNIREDALKALVISEFENFYEKNVKPYKLDKNIKIGFIGSVAWNFKDILLSVIENEGYKDISFLQCPMPMLEKYFLKETLKDT